MYISNLPIIIQNDSNNFAILGNGKNEFKGPTSSIPGPILPSVDATAEIELIISIPKYVKTIETITNTNIYKKKKPNILVDTDSDTTLLFIFIFLTALG